MATTSLTAASNFFAIRDQRDTLIEEWGDVIDPRERIREDAMFAGIGRWAGRSKIEDREDGKFLPVYETEEDLRLIRGQCRMLAMFDSVAIGATDSLANYVLGKSGFDFTVQPAKGQELSRDVAGRLQSLVDLIVESLGLRDDFAREIHQRSREDGEAFARLDLQGGKFSAETIEPDQIVQPANPRPLEEWLGCGEEFVSSWTFGIHTKHRQPSDPLGYHVVYDGAGTDWDYITADRMIRVKRNTHRNAKRGVSDFYAVLEDMRAESKLAGNMVTGAALQAAIAWIEEHPPGTTQAQAQSLAQGLSEGKITRPTETGQRQIKTQRFERGTILRPSAGKVYKPGPMGSERNKDFVEVAGFVLRRIGIRWVFPEYMISGDASNANFASTLVSESPFVKAREADQAIYAAAFKDAVLKGLKLAYDANIYKIQEVAQGEGWESLRMLFDIKVDPPSVATRDIVQLSTAIKTQMDLGLLSPKTAATLLNLDYEEEVKLGAKPAAPAGGMGGFGGAGSGGFGNEIAGALGIGTPSDALRRTVESVFESYP